MRTGVQFTGTLTAGQTNRWFTFNWPQQWHVVWYVISTSPRSGAPQIEWSVEVERASTSNITYWITITNVSTSPVDIEARYAVLNQVDGQMRIIIEIDERETTARKIIEPIGIEGQNAGAAPDVTSITASQITMMKSFDAIDAGPPVQAIFQRGKTLPSAQVGVATSDTNAGPAPDSGKDLH